MQSFRDVMRVLRRPKDVGYAFIRRRQKLLVPRTWNQTQTFVLPDSIEGQLGKSTAARLNIVLTHAKAQLADQLTDPNSFIDFSRATEIGRLNPQSLNYLAKLAWIFGGPNAAEAFHLLEARAMLGKPSSSANPRLSEFRALLQLSSWEDNDGALAILNAPRKKPSKSDASCFELLLKRRMGDEGIKVLFLAPSAKPTENGEHALTAHIWNRQNNHEIIPAGTKHIYYLNQGQFPYLKKFLNSLPNPESKWHETTFRVRQLPQTFHRPSGVERSSEWDCLMAFSPPLTGVNSVMDLAWRGHVVEVEGMDFYTNFLHAPSHYLRSGWSSEADEPTHHRAMRLNASLATHNLGLNWNIMRLLGLLGRAILTPSGGNNWQSRSTLVENMQRAFEARLAER